MYPPPSSHLHIGLATHAWALYRKYPWKWLGAATLCCVPQVLLWQVSLGLIRPPEQDLPENLTLRYVLIVGIGALMSGVNQLFQVGMCRLALDQLGGEPLRLGRLFRPAAGLGCAFLSSLLVALTTQLGYAMLVLPGLVLQAVFLLVIPILAERRLGVLPTLKLSVETLQPELVNAVLFAMFINFLTAFAGSAIGSAAWPLSLAGVIVCYPLVPQILALLYRSYFTYQSFEYRG